MSQAPLTPRQASRRSVRGVGNVYGQKLTPGTADPPGAVTPDAQVGPLEDATVLHLTHTTGRHHDEVQPGERGRGRDEVRSRERIEWDG